MDSVKVHELKTDPRVYNELVNNQKTHTTRLDDRGYKEGDYIVFRQTKYTGEEMRRSTQANANANDDNYAPLVYTGHSVLCKITHIHTGPGMLEGWVVCSVKIIDRFPGRAE